MITDEPETVVLVSVDCLRADTAADLPTLSRLADEHVAVTDCHSVGSSTPTSMPGLMQSQLSGDYGGKSASARLRDHVPTLAERLSEAGVHTAGWHSNVYTSRTYGYNRGFDVFADLSTHSPDTPGDLTDAGGQFDRSKSWVDHVESASERLGVRSLAERVYHTLRNHGIVDPQPSVPAETVVDALLDRLPAERDDTRRFRWGHLMDMHNPYFPPREYRERVEGCPVAKRDVWPLTEKVNKRPQDLSPDEIEDVRSLYRAAGFYVDDQLGHLVDELEARGLWEETLLVVTADHGEMFGDREIPDDYPFSHPSYLCEEVTHVPLVFAGGCVREDTVTTPASGMDVPATILDALGIARPDDWGGVAVGSRESAERDRVYSTTVRGTRQDKTVGDIPEDVLHAGFRTEDRAVLWWSSDAHPPQFYARTEEGERLVSAGDVSDAAELIESIDRRFRAVARDLNGNSAHAEDELDDRSTERLRQLGYIE